MFEHKLCLGIELYTASTRQVYRRNCYVLVSLFTSIDSREFSMYDPAKWFTGGKGEGVNDEAKNADRTTMFPNEIRLWRILRLDGSFVDRNRLEMKRFLPSSETDRYTFQGYFYLKKKKKIIYFREEKFLHQKGRKRLDNIYNFILFKKRFIFFRIIFFCSI